MRIVNLMLTIAAVALPIAVSACGPAYGPNEGVYTQTPGPNGTSKPTPSVTSR